MLRRSFIAAACYAALGLLGGLYYRTLTEARGFGGHSQLSLVHTHFLVLGFVGFLLVLALEKTVGLAPGRARRWFEICYHAGLIVTGGSMLARGSLDVLGVTYPVKALAGVAGLGHMTITVAIVLLFMALWPAVRTAAQDGPTTAVEAH